MQEIKFDAVWVAGSDGVEETNMMERIHFFGLRL
jgi:hypothetical protein